jgi:hypothetical protein
MPPWKLRPFFRARITLYRSPLPGGLLAVFRYAVKDSFAVDIQVLD